MYTKEEIRDSVTTLSEDVLVRYILDLQDEAHSEGYIEGYDEGHSDGYEEGERIYY